MAKYISTSQAQREFSAILKDVYDNGTVYIIYRYRKRIAVLKRPDQWNQTTLTKTEKQIEKLLHQLSDLFKQLY